MTAWKITLLATQWLLLSAQTTPEPYYKPKPLTPSYIEWLRQKNDLPPEEYDHEFKGELKVIRGTQQELRAYCPGAFHVGMNAVGCAKHIFDVICTIYILNDLGLQSIGYDLEIVFRHERGHCNGWKHEPVNRSGVTCWGNSCE